MNGSPAIAGQLARWPAPPASFSNGAPVERDEFTAVDRSIVLPLNLRRRVLVIDDHALIRRGLLSIVQMEPDLEVCAEAASRGEAIDKVISCLPDLVTLDLSIRDADGLELLKDILALRPALPVLVISMHDEAIYAERCLRAGARGYVSKQQMGDTVLAAIRTVLAGERYLSPATSDRFARQFLGIQTRGECPPLAALSDRELEVFRLLGTGRGTRDIAQSLGLSIKTIESYREHLKSKLTLHSGAELQRAATLWAETGSLP